MHEAEAKGQVADSMEVRKALMARVESGEITLVEAQAELAKIKHGAKAAGKVTRNPKRVLLVDSRLKTTDERTSHDLLLTSPEFDGLRR